MSKAEKFIKDYTRCCSNEILRNKNESFTNIPRKGEYNPWLTPDQARNAVEIAREETIKKVCEWLNENLPIYISYCKRGVGEGSTEFIEDLKNAFKV